MQIQRLAILPFKNQADESWNYLTEGLTEHAFQYLMNQSDWLIIAQESIDLWLQLEGGFIKNIYKKLQVDTLLTAELSVNGRLQLDLQLWQPATEEPIWRRQLVADLKQVVSFGNQLTEVLSTLLKTPKIATVNRSLPQHRQAYRAYLLGNHYLNRWDRGYTELAIAQFEKVIELEPDFIPAYLGIAKGNVFLVSRGWRKAEEHYPITLQQLERMLLINPNYGELYIYKGIIEFFYLLDWDSAYRNIERGLNNSSEASEAYAQLSLFWYGMRQYDKALEAIHAAMEYNPLSTSLLNMKGDVLVSAERYAEANKVFLSILELQPADKIAYENLMYIAALLRNERLTKKYLRVLDIDTSDIQTFLNYPRLGYVYAFLKRERELQSVIDYLKNPQNNTINPYGRLANIYAAQGRNDLALTCLEAMFANRTGIIFALTDPQFKPLRYWRRYQKLEQQIKLPTNLPSEKTLTIQSELKKSIQVNPDCLLYAQAEEKYTTIVVYNNFRLEKTLLRLTIKNLLKQLPAAQFWQCHRSFIINTSLELRAEGNARGYQLISDHYGFSVAVARSKIEEMKTLELE